MCIVGSVCIYIYLPTYFCLVSLVCLARWWWWGGCKIMWVIWWEGE